MSDDGLLAIHRNLQKGIYTIFRCGSSSSLTTSERARKQRLVKVIHAEEQA